MFVLRIWTILIISRISIFVLSILKLGIVFNILKIIMFAKFETDDCFDNFENTTDDCIDNFDNDVCFEILKLMFEILKLMFSWMVLKIHIFTLFVILITEKCFSIMCFQNLQPRHRGHLQICELL